MTLRDGKYDPRFSHKLTDFRNLQYVVWKQCVPGRPDPTPVQAYCCNFLQYGPDRTRTPFESPNDRVFFGGFRGLAKSWTAATIGVGYLALDPTLNVGVISGGQDKAEEITTFMQQIMALPELEHLMPGASGVSGTKPRWSRRRFDVDQAPASQAPSVFSKPISGMLVGSRADILIIDDCETPQNSNTQMLSEKLERWMSEFVNILKPGGRIIVLGTFQKEDSVYMTLPGKGYSPSLVPLRFPQPDDHRPLIPDLPKLSDYQGMLAPWITNEVLTNPDSIGKPMEPTRFDEVEIVKRELEMGRSQAQTQLYLNPTMSDRMQYPLRLSDLIVMDCDTRSCPEQVIWASSPDLVLNELPNPGLRGDYLHKPMRILGDWIKWEFTLVVVDPAGRGSDETAVGVIRICNGQAYLVHLWATLDGASEPHVVEEIADIAINWKANHLQYEDQAGDEMWGKIFGMALRRKSNSKRGNLGCSLGTTRQHRQKELRIIDCVEPILNAHRLVITPDVIMYDHSATSKEYKLLFQISRIKKVKGALVHDDRLDMVAIGLQWLNENSFLDTDYRTAMDNREADLEQDDYEEFMDDNFGGKPAEANWMSGSRHIATRR